MIRIALLSAALCFEGILYVVSPRAHAGEHAGASLCLPLAEMKASAAAHGDIRWTTLSPDQWQFLRGVFIMAPSTPAGMPFGESAALVTSSGDKEGGGIVVFVDGDMACEPMPVPKQLITLLMDLGTIVHQGDGM